ncbi:unnamed protein product [Pipistrellus nathusii]|uniref:Uncharacterized protein n=1 Tax=Pipistrellus nathusii TaxID=59473 RepID=A0ABN9ZU90_PIPNA
MALSWVAPEGRAGETSQWARFPFPAKDDLETPAQNYLPVGPTPAPVALGKHCSSFHRPPPVSLSLPSAPETCCLTSLLGGASYSSLSPALSPPLCLRGLSLPWLARVPSSPPSARFSGLWPPSVLG